jgi:DNA polymerase-3 subunit delta'
MQPLIGHQLIVRELGVLATSAEPPHALLFAGPEGTGRTALAIQYAMMLNCEQNRATEPPTAGASLFDLDAIPARPVSEPGATIPCGECRSCRLIAEGTHPDVVVVTPGDALCRPRPNESSHEKHPGSRDIRICQVRGMIDLSARFPFEARYRMIVIDPADRLAREASHTILKTLEEPPGHTVFALITAAPESIIETILSRCRRINVRTVPRTEIEAGLIGRGIEPILAARAAEASRGKPGVAIGFAAKPDLMGDRERLLEVFATVAAGRNAERFRHAGDLAEQWRRDRATVFNALDIWESFWEARLRDSASVDDPKLAFDALAAIEAVLRCRSDLLAQVQTRLALELMLLSFPRVKLPITEKEPTAAHA